MNQRNIRGKLIVFVVKILTASIIGFCLLSSVVGVVSGRSRFIQLKSRIETDLNRKGMTLIVNNGIALRSLAEDNAYAAIREIVSTTVQNDSDVAYGIYMDNDCRPWVMAFSKNKSFLKENPARLTDSISQWAHAIESPGFRELRSEESAPPVLEFAAPVFSIESQKLGVIRYGISTARQYEAILTEKGNVVRDTSLFIFISIAVSLGVFYASVQAARRQAFAITKPIIELTEATKAIALGDYSLPLKVVASDEIGTLADNFDKMRMTVKEYTGNLESMVEGRTKELETTMKKLSAMKDEAEAATKAKSEFLSNMSHEIRTPMNAVIGFGDLLRHTQLDTIQKDYVDTISTSGELLLSLINDILDISKIESQKVTLEEIDFDLEYLVESVLKLLRQRVKGKNLDLVLVYPENLPRYVKGDPTRIRQIFINLVGNSIKFTEEGSVTVSVRPHDGKRGEGEETIGFEFSVKDTGIGIPQEKHKAIFEAFTQVDSSITRKYGGTGLGLTITQSLALLMGGTIRVESHEGKGADFIVTLVLKKGRPAINNTITLIPTEGLRGKKVVVVDDNAQSREILANFSAAAGMELVCSVGSAKGALDWLDEDANTADVVLSDIMMPGTDGYTLCKKIRGNKRLQSLLVIALTSDALPGMAERTSGAGFDAYLSKPFTRHDLYGILQAVFGDSHKGDHRIITRHMVQELLTKGVRALVAEDNPLNQKLLGILLKQMDCVVDMAANGREAVDMAGKNKYDVIFMDIQMPVMDGFQATELIRGKLNLTTPIIALTAKVFQEDQEKCASAGMNDFLAKPVEIKTLKQMLLKWGRTADN